MSMTTLTFTNPTTGKEYQGGNIQRLQDCADSNPRFLSGAFATFRQWLSVGRCVAKGEKAAARLVYCATDALVPVADAPAGTVQHKRGFLKSFAVFALEQTTALDVAVANAALDEVDEKEAKEDKPEPGKVYSLATLAKVGTWSQATVSEPAKPIMRPRVGTATLREKSAALMRKADACHADRLTNTAKRLAQAMGKRLEGDRYKRQARMLSAIADHVDASPESEWACWSIRDLCALTHAAARFEGKHVNNGYHSYLVESDKPTDDSENARKARAMIDSRTQAAETAKSAQIQAEAELRQCDLPGFFPTPPTIIAAMLEQAGDMRGKTVLEPSAGKGDLVQAAFRAGARTVKSFEIVPRLAAYLVNHVQVPRLPCVHVSQNADFLEQIPICADARVDVVLMNPPFEKDAAPKHVLHALSWLKPGGKLVSVMPANWQEKASAGHLLRMIDDMGFSMMDMEIEGPAFNGADAFRQTAVRTSLLVIG